MVFVKNFEIKEVEDIFELLAELPDGTQLGRDLVQKYKENFPEDYIDIIKDLEEHGITDKMVVEDEIINHLIEYEGETEVIEYLLDKSSQKIGDYFVVGDIYEVAFIELEGD